MNRRRFANLLVVFVFFGLARPTPTPAMERWDRVVCLHTEAKKSDGKPAFASGFLVRHGDSRYLVTAGHAAKDAHAFTRILYRAPDGSSQWIHLGALTTKTEDPWSSYKNSDLSIMLIAGREAHAPQIEQLASLCIEFESLLQDAPTRTTDIEITGFPMLLGIRPTVSPLVMKGRLARDAGRRTMGPGANFVCCSHRRRRMQRWTGFPVSACQRRDKSSGHVRRLTF